MIHRDDEKRGKRTKSSTHPDRSYAEEFDQGDRLEWERAPMISMGIHGGFAPSCSGRISAKISGAALVRFDLVHGGESEPMVVTREQLCRRSDGK